MFTLDACIVQMMFSYHDLMYCYNQKSHKTLFFLQYTSGRNLPVTSAAMMSPPDNVVSGSVSHSPTYAAHTEPKTAKANYGRTVCRAKTERSP